MKTFFITSILTLASTTAIAAEKESSKSKTSTETSENTAIVIQSDTNARSEAKTQEVEWGTFHLSTEALERAVENELINGLTEKEVEEIDDGVTFTVATDGNTLDMYISFSDSNVFIQSLPDGFSIVQEWDGETMGSEFSLHLDPEDAAMFREELEPLPVDEYAQSDREMTLSAWDMANLIEDYPSQVFYLNGGGENPETVGSDCGYEGRVADENGTNGGLAMASCCSRYMDSLEADCYNVNNGAMWGPGIAFGIAVLSGNYIPIAVSFMNLSNAIGHIELEVDTDCLSAAFDSYMTCMSAAEDVYYQDQ